eukprot:6577955-Prymnesium_polylepis.1
MTDFAIHEQDMLCVKVELGLRVCRAGNSGLCPSDMQICLQPPMGTLYYGAVAPTHTSACRDNQRRKKCERKARKGKCISKNPLKMAKKCARTCNLC